MTKRKLIADGTTGGQSSLELTNNNPDLSVYVTNFTLTGGAPILFLNLTQIGTPGAAVGNFSVTGLTNGNGGNIFKLNGPEIIEVINNGILTITSNDLPLESIVATSGTIQLNNNYMGNVKTAVQVGNNNIISLTGIELPLGTVTIEKDAIFSFTHNNIGMQINTLNNSISTLNLVIKDIHAVVETSYFLDASFNHNNVYAGIITEGIAARIYETNKEAVSLFMKQNNMICEPTKIEPYFDQHYLKTTGVADNLIGSDFGNLPTELVGEIFSYIDYSNDNGVDLA